MPYNLDRPTRCCTVCNSEANIDGPDINWDLIVDCARCGDFQISRITSDQLGLPYITPKERALASHVIRKMQAPRYRPILTIDFFDLLRYRTLPTPVELSDNFIIWLAEQQDGRPGNRVNRAYSDPPLLAVIGAVEPEDVEWIVGNLRNQGWLCSATSNLQFDGYLSETGWRRFEELKQARISSSFAFFARRFSNTELDQVFERCLYPAVQQTGYELRTVPQRAGLIDAVIENEIRRCRFLIADLSDDNAGAYWEAGFAEGLGKPVVYVCCANKRTHFDTDHRQTVWWDLASLDQTAIKLKAVIRNTLLGEAKQTD
jgi:hypothetical protein